MKKKVTAIILLLFLLATFTSCSSENDALTGCFSTEKNGEPTIKIGKDSKRFYVQVLENGNWSDKTMLRPGSAEDLKSIFHDDAKKVRASLAADKAPFAIFHVFENEEYDGKKADSEFLALLFFGGGSVYKVKCE